MNCRWECKMNMEMVLDYASGDAICMKCGFVLEPRTIDERSEQRTFVDEDLGDHDPNPVGGPVSQFFGDVDLGDHDPNRVRRPVNPILGDSSALSTTKISKGDPTLGRLQNRKGGDPDRALMMAFKMISSMADRLSLVKTIEDRASEIYKRLEDKKCARGRGKKMEPMVAACVYIACRQEGKRRTVIEICSVVNGRATRKEIRRAKEFIVKQLERDSIIVEMQEQEAPDYLWRFCSNLGMSNEEVKAVQESVHKAVDFDIRRSPVSIAAAIIFMITQLSDSKKTLQEISIATTVAQGTIKNVWKDLYPHAAKIIPQRLNGGICA